MDIETEIESLERLRDKYLQAARKYSKKIFNVEQLEDRIRIFRKNRYKNSITDFLLKEMNLFEKMKKIAQDKMNAHQKQVRGETHLDKMIAKNEVRIKKYQPYFFHPSSSIEIRHLVGALSEFYESFYHTSKYIIRGDRIWSSLTSLFGELERFCIFTPGSKPGMLQKYIEDILQAGGNHKELIDGKYIQTAGLILYKINLEYKNYISKMNEEQKQAEIAQTSDTIQWTGETYGRFILEAMKKSKEILDDFRVTDLVVYAFEKNDR